MTECSENLVREWKQNEYLAEFVRQDLLEFGVFAAEEESCSADNGWLAERHKSSLIVIANYVFDSLPQDAFAVEGGQLYEFMLTSSCAGKSRDFQDLRFSFAKSRVGSTHYLHPEWNSILEQYRARLSKATVLFPATALKALQSLRERSNGAFLVLAADKGITHEDDLTFLRGEPPLEFHASKRCFSQIVNFDALAKDFQNRGGEAFLPQKSFSSLNLCAFLDHPPEACFSATRNAYRQATEAFGPDDLFALMSWLNDHLEQIPLAQAIALLRLTRWDPTALARLFPAIASQARNAGSQRNDLRDAVLKTWANHYPLSKDENILAFSCGVILLELRFFSEAHEMFRKSQQLFEPSAATSYNLGLCCLGMDRPDDALELMREACSLDPTFQPAQQSRLRLESQLSI
jgi:tetratricopeptide (TPR) repeat protein